MKKYLSLVKRQTNQNFVAEFLQVPREEKEHVDRVAKAASTEHMIIDHQVLSFTQHFPATKELEIQVILVGIGWMIHITSYLKNGMLPEDHNASRR